MPSVPQASRRNVIRGALVVGVAGAAGGGALLTANLAQAENDAKAKAPEIFSCEDWGARPGSGSQLSNKPTKIVIHHTASANQSDTSKQAAFKLAKDVQSWHMDGNGWSDTGNNFTISRGGFIMEGRHTSLKHLNDGKGWVQSAHAPGANSDGIGIENEGTYTDGLPPKELWNALVQFCAHACKQFGIAPKEIYGHRDFSSTACPGEAFYAKLPQLRKDVEAALNGDGGGGGDDAWTAVVDNGDKDVKRGEGWKLSAYSADKHGKDYAFAEPGNGGGLVEFTVTIPKDGTYTVSTWYAANKGYNPKAPYTVHAGGTDKAVTVDQTAKGGQWVSLGDYKLKKGKQKLVSVGHKTTGKGYVIADAIQVKAKK
ncbi:N-acetylmuramoyl-L-alanine amidase [Stackebrandtia nassauensis]|nr:N-acetylmuramoyl-L-alanine amidase [Stackebrandtia nassauensis]